MEQVPAVVTADYRIQEAEEKFGVFGIPASTAQIMARHNAILELMSKVMVKGKSYGIIPGCGKPSLFKAGAEEINSLFGLVPDPVDEDLSWPKESPKIVRHRVTCKLMSATGRFLGSAIGECSSDEEKYAWKSAGTPEEFDETPEDRKRTKWKKDNKGKSYGTKQIRTNPADVGNTILMMAAKRAFVAIVRTATGASALFAQDLEDLEKEVREAVLESEGEGEPPKDPKDSLRDKAPPLAAPPAPAAPPPASAPAPAPAPAPATKAPPAPPAEGDGWPAPDDLDDNAIGEYFDDAVAQLAIITGEEAEAVIKRVSEFKAGDKVIQATSREHLTRWKGGIVNVRKIYGKIVAELNKSKK